MCWIFKNPTLCNFYRKHYNGFPVVDLFFVFMDAGIVSVCPSLFKGEKKYLFVLSETTKLLLFNRILNEKGSINWTMTTN